LAGDEAESELEITCVGSVVGHVEATNLNDSIINDEQMRCLEGIAKFTG
tara:strand:- start:540 stop:686 length:147 start_codon:yes stop_codon:yes gene_type:complete